MRAVLDPTTVSSGAHGYTPTASDIAAMQASRANSIDGERAACIKHSRTRPYRPQTNGKIERFHRTMSDGWGYARCYNSESERRQALPAWLHEYNHHRPHTACGNKPPFTRLINLSGQYN